MKTYQEYEDEQNDISGCSIESYYAEKAWKAALAAAAKEFESRGIYGADLLKYWSEHETT